MGAHMTDTKELEALLSAATPLPWTLVENFRDAFDPYTGHYTVPDGTAFLNNQGNDAGEFEYADAALIVAAVNALTAHLARIAELEAALKQIAQPDATFAGPKCCGETFNDACEMFSDIARAALSGGKP
jgi:hypothetical protein